MAKYRIGIVVLATVISWYGMMAVHELGHCIGAWASGGSVVAVEIPLVGFSHTTFVDSSHPLVALWMGPILGAILPLVALVLVSKFNVIVDHVIRYYCGFCLIANGLYLGVGVFERVGDCGALIQSGASPWQLLGFGIIATSLGGYSWHRMGHVKHWFAVGRGNSPDG